MSTDDTSTYSQVPADGSSSDNKSDADSSRRATYEDLIQNSELFWDKLRDLLEDSGKNLKVLTVGGESLDLHRLFIEVTTRGGIAKVIKDRKCKEVIGTFNLNLAVTNAATVLKKNYLELLFEFEHLYFFQQPISSFWAREEALNRLVGKSAYHDKGTQSFHFNSAAKAVVTQELQPGCVVTGILDGKFDDGYYVTMKMGPEMLRGVVYPSPETSLETGRRKKKPKLSQADPYRPKSHRNGYNFFFSDQYQRLKPEYAGKESLIMKDIGYMWKNLSESDRKVYQDKGLEDVERYKTEMSEYKSFINSCGAESVAVTDAAATEAEAESESEYESGL